MYVERLSTWWIYSAHKFLEEREEDTAARVCVCVERLSTRTIVSLLSAEVTLSRGGRRSSSPDVGEDG